MLEIYRVELLQTLDRFGLSLGNSRISGWMFYDAMMIANLSLLIKELLRCAGEITSCFVLCKSSQSLSILQKEQWVSNCRLSSYSHIFKHVQILKIVLYTKSVSSFSLAQKPPQGPQINLNPFDLPYSVSIRHSWWSGGHLHQFCEDVWSIVSLTICTR